jgi:hypothetical protein
MTPSELLDCHDQLCGRAKALMESKNRDYRGATEDPFANFRGAQFLGIDPIVGIAMRMMDKLQRVRAFATTGTLAVKAESFEDAVLDLINYSILMAGMASERGPQPGKPNPFWEQATHGRNRPRCQDAREVATEEDLE